MNEPGTICVVSEIQGVDGLFEALRLDVRSGARSAGEFSLGDMRYYGMKVSSPAAVVISSLCLFPGSAVMPDAYTHASVSDSLTNAERAPVHARGTFEVKLVPQGAEDKGEGSTLGRLSLDKQFQGDLEGTGKGEMLTGLTDVKGSGGYVAIERVTGTLHGRRGSFVLLHRGIMSQGAQDLTITVVPDSGAGQLVGLTGKLNITIVEGKHFYDLEYTLKAP